MTGFKIRVLEQAIRTAAIGLGIVLGLSLFAPVEAAPSGALVDCLRSADQVWGWESEWGYHCQDVDPNSPPGSLGFQEALNQTVVARQHNFYAHEKNRQAGFDLRDKRTAANPCKVSKVGTGYGFVGKDVARMEFYEVSSDCFK